MTERDGGPPGDGDFEEMEELLGVSGDKRGAEFLLNQVKAMQAMEDAGARLGEMDVPELATEAYNAHLEVSELTAQLGQAQAYSLLAFYVLCDKISQAGVDEDFNEIVADLNLKWGGDDEL